MSQPVQVIDRLVRRFPGAIIVSTCGLITRDLLAVADRPKNFYLVGSMGMALPIGLGIALARPAEHIIVVDGDGSFAMNTGASLMLSGVDRPVTHVVLDNGHHESTGGQAVVSVVDFGALGRGLGYDEVVSLDAAEQLDHVPVDTSVRTLLRVRCELRTGSASPRLGLAPPQLVERFREALAVSEVS